MRFNFKLIEYSDENPNGLDITEENIKDNKKYKEILVAKENSDSSVTLSFVDKDKVNDSNIVYPKENKNKNNFKLIEDDLIVPGYYDDKPERIKVIRVRRFF